MGKRLDLIHLSICNCLQGAGDFRKQTGVAYLPYVSHADRGKVQHPVSYVVGYNLSTVPLREI